MALVAKMYPHLSKLREFKPDVPIVIGGQGGVPEDDELDDDAAFGPLADSMADLVADSDRGNRKQAVSIKKPASCYDMKPYVYEGFEALYQTTTHGKPRPTATTKRSAELVTEGAIDLLLESEPICCSTGKCLKLWMADLDAEKVRAIITTERGAYASMGETARRVHYMTWLKQLRVPQYATSPSGKKVLTGEELPMLLLMLSTTT
jgi:hypothetical protein